MDIPNHDIPPSPHVNATEAECQTMCDENAACVGLIYLAGAAKSECWLKAAWAHELGQTGMGAERKTFVRPPANCRELLESFMSEKDSCTQV